MKTKQELKLTLNIGTVDQQRLGLESANEGDIVDVDQKTAAELIRRGWGAAIPAPTTESAPTTAKRGENFEELGQGERAVPPVIKTVPPTTTVTTTPATSKK